MIMRLQALSLVAAGAALSCQSVGAFTFSASHSAKHEFSLASSVNSDDAAFSSFASSLEQDSAAPVKATSGNSKRKSTTPEATWKTDLDEILNPTTAQARRQILLSQLLTANADIRVSVEAALRDRKVRHLCHYLYQRSLLALLYTASFPFV
jgi:isochorismate synthase EntC